MVFFDISIFLHAEVEPCSLHHSNNDLEWENALLSKHNENLRGMLKRLDHVRPKNNNVCTMKVA